jgi:superfamily II DNA/RNA helicase
MLFSATMPGPIITLARTFLDRPTHIRGEEVHASAIGERTRQFVYRAHSLDKMEVIARALQAKDRGLTMIFARTKRTAQKVTDELTERGFAAAAVHGDLGQGAREQALRAFRSGKVDVLIATDVAARGIDIDDVTHVINYQCPEDEKTYVHRIGRTGRAGKAGVAITLVDWDEEPRWKLISDSLELEIPEPVETYSTSEHLHTDLDVPEDVTGRLPLAKRTRTGLDSEPEEEFGEKRRKRSRSGGRNRRGGRSNGPARNGEQSGDGGSARDGESGGNRPARRRTRGGKPDARQAEPVAVVEQQQSSGGEQGERPTRRRRRRRSGPSSEADTEQRSA